MLRREHPGASYRGHIGAGGRALTRGSVELRNVSEACNLRRLTASLDRDGDLVIEGLDAGDEVERFFGFREYEWIWTIRAEHVPGLLRALGASSDVLSALEERFSGDRAAGLKAFLEEHDVPHEVWSRVGD